MSEYEICEVCECFIDACDCNSDEINEDSEDLYND